MNALIVGGTSGFGEAVFNSLSGKGLELITVSRSKSKYKSRKHYFCDIGNLGQWIKTLNKIKLNLKSLDLAIFIVGFAEAKSFNKLTEEDWQNTLTKNVIYVSLAIQELESLLSSSKNPKIVTIGSQWSYKVGNNFLVPYIVAKHALRTLTKDISIRNRKIKSNHYCMPTMDTPQYWKVRESFNKIGEEEMIRSFSPEGLADPMVVAKNLVRHVLQSNVSGFTFVIERDGKVRELNEKS